MQTIVFALCDLQQLVLSKQIALGLLPADYSYRAVRAVETRTANGETRRHTNLRCPPSRQLPVPELVGLTSVAEFPCVFDGICRRMVGPPCHFTLRQGAIPVAIRGSHPVLEPLIPLLKQEFAQLEAQGIIRKVIEPTYWVHPIVIAPKQDGGITLCVDFRQLNRSFIRPRLDSASPFQAVRTIPKGMKFFAVFDALKGYHKVELNDASVGLTTFSTSFGRFQYRHLPLGISLAGDDYCRRTADIFEDLQNSKRIIEDVIV